MSHPSIDKYTSGTTPKKNIKNITPKLHINHPITNSATQIYYICNKIHTFAKKKQSLQAAPAALTTVRLPKIKFQKDSPHKERPPT